MWRYRQVDRQEEDVPNSVETCGRRSASDGRLEYAIGKDEARERPEMSTPVGCRIRSSSSVFDGQVRALRDPLHRVESSSESSRMQLLFSLLLMSCRAQKDSCMTLSYPFTVRKKHRRVAGPSGDES